MLQAMNTGHEGSLSTVHANSPRDAISRIENMVLLGGVDLPVTAIREQLASALHMIIQLQRFADGKRSVVKVTEVTGMEGQTVTLQDLFVFRTEGVEDGGGDTWVVPTYGAPANFLRAATPPGLRTRAFALPRRGAAMIAVLAAFAGALSVFVAVGAVTGQFSFTQRRLVARASEVALRGERGAAPATTGTALRTDAYAGSRALSQLLARFSFAEKRAKTLDRANVPLKVSEYLLIADGPLRRRGGAHHVHERALVGGRARSGSWPFSSSRRGFAAVRGSDCFNSTSSCRLRCS